MQARVAFRERSLLDVVDLAVRFLAANARPYAVLAAFTIVPAFAVCWWVASAGGWLLGWIAAFVLASVVDAPFLELASKLVFSPEARVRDALRTAAALLPRLVLVRLLQGTGLAFSLLLGGLPWLWLGSILLFVPEVVVLERSKAGAAYRRARGLAMVRLGVVSAAVLLLSILPIGAALVADVAGRETLQTILEIRPPKSVLTEGGSAFALLGFWLVVPLRATTRFFVYLDVRTRIEGWDIQTRFAALAARAAGTLAAVLGALVIAFAAPVGAARAATLDPTKAGAALDAARRAHDYAFCREPEKPLSEEARALCPHAESIPDCQGLEKACTDTPDEEFSGWKRFARWLAAQVPSWLKDFFRALANLPRFVFLLAVAVAIAAAAVAVVRAVRAMRREAAFRPPLERTRSSARDREAPAPTVTTDEEALLAQAGERAKRGENEAALQLYLAAALRALDRRGAVRWGRDRTNGEYVRSCLEAPSREPLREIVREVDEVQFGSAPATESAVARAAVLAQGIVRWTPVVMLALVLPMLGGCAKLQGRVGADPAGQDLFEPWLRQQGMDVAPLDAPLDELEATHEGRTRAVVIDTETTALDEETKTHLETWVTAGGTLVLAGPPATWPKAFRAKDGPPAAAEQKVTAPGADGGVFTGHLARAASLQVELSPGEPKETKADEASEDDDDNENDEPADVGVVARLDDGATYASALRIGRGAVVEIASDELLTNAGLARPGNAAVLAAILAHAGTSRFAVAEPEDGSAPAGSPIAALMRSGLGLALLQAAVAAALLGAAAGVRLVAPRPTAPDARRGFVEHVVAAGALYATAGAARHALTVYTRFIEQRLRAQMPRGAHDFAAFLSARSGIPPAECANLWSRAVAAAHTAGQGNAEDLRILQSLYELHSATLRRGP